MINSSWSEITNPYKFKYFIFGHSKRSRLVIWHLWQINPELKSTQIMLKSDFDMPTIHLDQKVSGIYSEN